MYLIQLTQGFVTLVLQGIGLAAPYQGAVMAKERQPGGQGTQFEEIICALEGSPAEIENAVQDLRRWAEEAGRVRWLGGVEPVYLEAQPFSAGGLWRSRVVGGDVQVVGSGAAQRGLGSQGVRLRLERVDYWEAALESELYLSSQASSRRTGGVTISSHWDTSASNWVNLAVGDLTGDLPAPLRLVFSVSGLAANGSVYCGQNIHSTPGTAQLSLQGEGAAAVSPAGLAQVASSSASGGYFGRVTWSGTGAVVVRFGLSTGQLQSLKGYAFLPVMRIANPIGAGEQFWAAWRAAYNVSTNSDVLAESRAGYLLNNDQLQPGSPLSLPPWMVESGESPAGLDLELVLLAEGSGAHTLDIDYVFLLPLERWRIYRMTASYLAGLAISDNPYAGTLKSYNALQGHQAEGPGVWAAPGAAQRYYFLVEAAGLAPGSHTASVRMYYRPRRAQL